MFASFSRRALAAAALATLLSAGATDHDASPPGSPAGHGIAGENGRGASRAYGVWRPGKPGECDRTIHDRYSVLGPDGKLYPTWHPPLDPSGCSFGHEHGADPRGSALASSIGAIPFGYANEVQAGAEAATAGYDDHAGHRVEWENGVSLEWRGVGQRVDAVVRCDFLIKGHREPGAADAPDGRRHEFAYHLRCSDQTDLHLTVLSDHDPSARFVRNLTQGLMRLPQGQWYRSAQALQEDWEAVNLSVGPARRRQVYVEALESVLEDLNLDQSRIPGRVGRATLRTSH